MVVQNLKSLRIHKNITLTQYNRELLAGNIKEEDIYLIKPEEKSSLVHEKYFDIDVDGFISLKPEYRSDVTEEYKTLYPFSVSDNGIEVEGSKILDLPESLIIPYEVDGEQVVGLQNGIFCRNKKIREIILSPYIQNISNGAFLEAIYLEKIYNTEQIEHVGEKAFAFTRIFEIRLPNLISLESGAFENCSCLKMINLGKTTSIPERTFLWCENLVEVLDGQNITSVGAGSFFSTRRLKTLPFLSKLTNIGYEAFASSGCDFEEVYETLVNNGCTFGEDATYKQFNNNNDEFWHDVTFTPCKTQLKSLFHQKNPIWNDKVIKGYENSNEGQGYRYGPHGCAFIVLAEIYSAFEGVEFDSPEQFAEIIYEKGLHRYEFRYRENGWIEMAKGLGYDVEFISVVDKNSLQRAYNALAEGALLYKSTLTPGKDFGGHAMLGYGINSKGEMLTADSSMHCYKIGIYDNHKAAWHIYKHGSDNCDIVIVKKAQ